MALLKSSKKALIRCDFGSEIGYGHIVRSLALADSLKACGNWQIIFATIGFESEAAYIRAFGYDSFVSLCNSLTSQQERDWIQSIRADFDFDLLLADVRTDLTVEDLTFIRDQRVSIVLIDDSSPRRFAADLCFFPPVPQVDGLGWEGFNGKYFCGPEWVILRAQFPRAQMITRSTRHNGKTPKLLITMGGSDPLNLSTRALKALEKIDVNFNISIIIGAGFQHLSDLEFQIQSGAQQVKLLANVEDMAEVMSSADLAIASFGVTAYELASVGVPSILYSLTEDHERSASFLIDAGAAISIGSNEQYVEERIISAINLVLSNKGRLLDMSIKAGALFDGNGARRIALKLDALI